MEKNILEKEHYIYIYIWLNHFAVQQKLTQHCKSTILQKIEKINHAKIGYQMNSMAGTSLRSSG